MDLSDDDDILFMCIIICVLPHCCVLLLNPLGNWIIATVIISMQMSNTY